MSRFASLARAFARDERGLETVEYAVMTALVVAGIVMALVSLGGSLNTRYGETESVIGVN
tara:strand:+ start:276 stop:455 length:180 start_codon:yes stop_codon:yes gene_type:complete